MGRSRMKKEAHDGSGGFIRTDPNTHKRTIKEIITLEDKMGLNTKQQKQWRPLQGNGSPPRKGKGLAGA